MISQRLQFIHLGEDGSAVDGGAAPYLDYRPITEGERALIADVIKAPWLRDGVEQRAIGFAIAHLVPQHLGEVKRRRLAEIDKVEREVRARLNSASQLLGRRAARLREEERAGREQRINAVNAEATAQRLVDRLHARQTELERERDISALPPILRGAALVVPKGLLDALANPARGAKPDGFAEDPSSRAEVERLAMEAVMEAEERMGFIPLDVSVQKKGWDIESRTPEGHLRFIEVKGRRAHARDVILTKNEILASLNAPDAFHLALVRVEAGFAHAPIYVQRFCQRELGFAETAVMFNIADLLSLASAAS